VSTGRAHSTSVIVPTYQSASYLKRCLAALAASSHPPLEIIVVDDGSTDGSADVARSGGAVVLRVPDGPRGPAVARNLGAARARGEFLLFLDADVAVHPESLEKFEDCLDDNPDVAAVFGSYDDNPDHLSFVSQYRNLLHHFVHRQGRREASTFWAGCGVIRRRVFEQAGGFSERYRRPSVEDIDLGGRLREAGHRVWLRADIQATHLKRWTFMGIVLSDVRDRAIPWSHLILRQGQLPQDLNTSRQSRASAVAAWAAVGAAGAAWVVPEAAWAALVALTALVAINAGMYGFFLRKRGVLFAVVAVAMHGLYLLYSSAIFATLSAAHRLGIRPDR
jgi:hypothetical protein